MSIVQTGFSFIIGSGQGNGPGTLAVTFAAGECVIVTVYGGLQYTNGGTTDPHMSDDSGVNTYNFIGQSTSGNAVGNVSFYKADNVVAGTFNLTTGVNNGFGGYPYAFTVARYTGVKAGLPNWTGADIGSLNNPPDNAVFPSFSSGGSVGLYIAGMTTQNSGADGDIMPGTGFTSPSIPGNGGGSNCAFGWETMPYSVGGPFVGTFSVNSNHGYEVQHAVIIALESSAPTTVYRRFGNAGVGAGYVAHLNGILVPPHFKDA